MFKLLLGNTLRIAGKAKPLRFLPTFRSFSINKKEMSEFNKFFLQPEDEIPDTTLPTKQLISKDLLNKLK